MANLQICVVCGAHVGLEPTRASAESGFHVATGYAGETLLDDYWVHYRCIGDGPGDGIEM